MNREKYMWFFLDEEGKVVAQTLREDWEEEKAIDELTMQVENGKYSLGFVKADGTRHVFNFKQVVTGRGHKEDIERD